MRWAAVEGILLVAAVGISCDDSLPVYEAPTDFLRVNIQNLSPPEVSYTYIENGNDISLLNVIVTSAAQSFSINVVNTFDETLQDVPDVSGELEISSLDLPSLKATIPVTVTNLSGSQYNAATKILTLDPGDTLKMRCTWRYKTDDGKWAFEKADVASESEIDPDNPPYRGSFERTHVPMNFSMTAHIRLFPATNTSASEKEEFKLLFHGHIVLPL